MYMYKKKSTATKDKNINKKTFVLPCFVINEKTLIYLISVKRKEALLKTETMNSSIYPF